MAETGSGVEEKVERVEERPGLTLVKRVTRKEDGRWLIYFDFEREADQAPGAAAGGAA